MHQLALFITSELFAIDSIFHLFILAVFILAFTGVLHRLCAHHTASFQNCIMHSIDISSCNHYHGVFIGANPGSLDGGSARGGEPEL